jgi:sporulation integral membrane protein YtvI
MFSDSFIKDLKAFGIFFILYTIVFIIFFGTISYTFPFVIAFLIALLIQPVTRFLRYKLKFKKNIPSIIASGLIYVLFFSIIIFLFYQIINEAKQLLVNLSTINLDIVINPVKNIIAQLGSYFEKIDPSFIEKNISQITNVLSNSMNIIGKSLSAFLSLAVSIPVLITVLFVIILSTYFFSRDMSSIRVNVVSIFSEKGKEKFSSVWYHGLKMLGQYVKAYSIIYSLTFLQTLIGFSLLRVKYAVILSILCAIADVLPVLGIGLIYLPLSAIYLISGNYFAALGILVLFVLISVVRQIVEPKIVSTSLGIHPLLVLAAIFIGLQAYGFTGMIYLTFMVVFYKILKASKIF